MILVKIYNFFKYSPNDDDDDDDDEYIKSFCLCFEF